MVEKNPGFAGWVADEELVVRGALAPLPDGGMNLMVRDPAGAEWRELLSIPADDVTTTDVVSFSEDGQCAARHHPARRQHRPGCSGSTWRPGNIEVLAEDAEADVDGVVLHPDTARPADRHGAQGPA